MSVARLLGLDRLQSRSPGQDRCVDSRRMSDLLLERQEILGRLRSIVAESRRGSGRLVLVAGEAGIGKTSVVTALAESLPVDTTLYWGACDAVTPPRPFAPLFDIAHLA